MEVKVVKRLFILLCMIMVCSLLSACKSDKNSDNIEVEYGDSEQFSDTEMESAIDAIIEKFNDFEGCELIKIWYDENKSNLEVERYHTSGNGLINGVKKENVIIFYSDFKVDSTGRNPVLNPDSTYTDWMWILIREDKTKEWVVDDWGY